MADTAQKSRALDRLAGGAIARYISFAYRTSTPPQYLQEAQRILRDNHPCIVAFWHGQFMLIPALTQPECPTRVMLARHRDAAFLAEAMKRFDMDLIRGAGAGTRRGDKGGANAFRLAVHALRDGYTVGMTADVPPGPARRCGPGVIAIARVSGRPIVPIALASSRYRAANTWSRMTLNLPYSRIGAWMGEPMYVPEGATPEELERLRQALEDKLNEITTRAYELAGADPERATPGHMLATLKQPIASGWKLRTYQRLTRLARPAVPLLLALRERRGKEDPARRSERFGQASVRRPDGPLIWMHAASVGETNAILPLLASLKEARPDRTILLTTGTVTSARLAGARLGATAIHQYVPLDSPRYVQAFLDHWRPELAIFCESEIWPNMILETSARGVPLALVNGRVSKTSFRRWRANATMARPIFTRFKLVLAQNDVFATRFRDLGAPQVITCGNLKIDSPPLPVDQAKLRALATALSGRPVLLAASTHEGEEAMVFEAHARIAAALPGLATIIAPRHPDRAPQILRLAEQAKLSARLRSAGDLPDDQTDVYIADTIGELGALYTIAPLALIGGSLIERGGQNPIEAIRFDAAVLTGPHVANFADAYAALGEAKACVFVADAAALADAAIRLLGDDKALNDLRTRAEAVRVKLAGALPRTRDALLDLLPIEDLRRAS
jgi:3-deoxy-D-manno-octulosonic-acid transferase